MMILTSSDRVVQRFNLPEDAGVFKAVNSALLAVTPFLETRLSSPLSWADYGDLFKVDSDVSLPVKGFYRLRTSAMFINAASVSVTYGDTFANRAANTLSADDYRLNAEMGVISVSEDLKDNYFAVNFSAGVVSADDTSETPDGAAIPEWLHEVAVSCCGIMLTVHAQVEGAPEVTVTKDTLQKHMDFLIAAHWRRGVVSISPIM